MDTSIDALSVLSAMITPAVLISACGSLILATSDRLSKAVARTREVSNELMVVEPEAPEHEEERRMLFTQLDQASAMVWGSAPRDSRTSIFES
ncbi:MAG: DUF2721 domain-containing protein [Gemmatimonadaceae bacterium]